MCLHDNITRPKNTQQSPLNPHNKTQKPQAPARMVRGITVDEQENLNKRGPGENRAMYIYMGIDINMHVRMYV